MHVFEVLSIAFPKQWNFLIKDILCNHCDVFLPGRCFSAHNACFTCYRYEFRSGIFKNLLNFSVAEYPCNDYWFFPLLVFATNNNGFPCDCYSIFPESLHYQRQQQSPANLALCAEFYCNGYGVNGAHLNADLIVLSLTIAKAAHTVCHCLHY